jgi:hypothetical protein
VSSPEIKDPLHMTTRRVPLVAWALLAAAGAIVWVLCLSLMHEQRPRVWHGLLINFLFFTPLSAGMVAWSAVVQASRGRWAGSLEQLALAGRGGALPSLVILAVLWASSPIWSPAWSRPLPQGQWLNRHFLFARDWAALAIYWIMAFIYTRQRAAGGGKTLGAFLIVAYGLVFSLLGFDLVMALDPKWYSTLAGGYFFVSGMYAAVAVWALLSAFRADGTGDRLHDLGKIVVALSILTAYLAYAHVFVIWYENLPAETRFLVPRMNYSPWIVISWVIVGLVYLGPLILLLTVWSKRTRWFLASILIIVLAALWVERWWLVAPTFSEVREIPHYVYASMVARFGAPELSALALLLGLTGWAVQAAAERLPAIVEETPQP